MTESLFLEGHSFKLLGAQRGGARVYRGQGAYLRIGKPEVLQRDLSLHRLMEKAKFPVAKVLHEGVLGGEAYFIEESLGDASFRAMFEADMMESGISSLHFRSFIGVLKRLGTAQAKIAEGKWDAEEFAGGINLPLLLRELPAHATELRARYVRAAENLAKLPKTLTHGDCNAANMYEGGIIDLEDSFFGPYGFDLVSAIMTAEWSPERKDYEFHAQYRFTGAQRKECMKTLDVLGEKAGIRTLSSYFDDLAFCRAVWLCAGMGEWPKIQQWRFVKFIDTYLS